MEAFLELYSTLNSSNLPRLRDVYREDIRFIDPAHEINGISNLIDYFEKLYANVQSIEFSFNKPITRDGSGFVRWEMFFRHNRLAGGNPIKVEGATYIEFDRDGRVSLHRDYFDLGAMVYEHITLLGRVVTFIKRGLGK